MRAKEGWAFICSDLGVGDNLEVARSAEILVIAVPAEKTAGVIRQVVPHMQKGALLIEICSLKMHLKQALDFAAKHGIEVLSLHPLFGPVQNIAGENIAVIKVKSGRRAEKMLAFLRAEGANVFETTLEEHDQKVAVTQSLFHLLMTKLNKLADDRFKTFAFKIATERSLKFEKESLFKAITEQNPFLKNAIEDLTNEINIKKC